MIKQIYTLKRFAFSILKPISKVNKTRVIWILSLSSKHLRLGINQILGILSVEMEDLCLSTDSFSVVEEMPKYYPFVVKYHQLILESSSIL